MTPAATDDSPMKALAFDAQAFFYVQGLFLVALPLTAWTILAGRHDAKPVMLWCLSGLMAAAGLILSGLRGQIPEWLGYPGAAFLAFGAYFVLGGVLLIEQDLRPRWIVLLAVTLATTAGYEWCRANGRDERELFGASVRLGAGLWLAWLSRGLLRREHTRSAMLLGAVFALSALASVARIVSVASDWGEGVIPTALDYALVNFTGLLAALYANLGYVGLVLERYRSRDRAQESRLQHEPAGPPQGRIPEGAARRYPSERDLRAELELHAQFLETLRAERRDALDETTPAMMHSIDAHGRLLAVSDAWLSKLGYVRQEVIGRRSTDFLTEDSRTRALTEVLPEFFRTGRCDDVRYEMQCKDGSVLDVRLSAVLVKDAQGAPVRSLAVIEDVTRQRARDAELAREQALRQEVQQRVQELDALVTERTDMLDVLAHEVRQPLNTASAALQGAVTALGGAQPQAATERLLSARRVLGEALSSLNNTLSSAALLAGSEPAATDDTDIDLLLDIVLGDVSPAARERVRIERLAATRTAAMDFGLVRLALRNLLDNALDYSPPGSIVALRVCDSDQPLALVLEVADDGPGIEAGLRDRLFQRGARGLQGRGRAGSGLGLYIVRRVAELHGGRVEAARGVEGGTIMRLWLPQGRAG